VSSQCLKRHWRTAEDDWGLNKIGVPMAVRSRHVVEREIMPGIEGAPEVLEAVRVAIAGFLFGPKNVEVKKRQALLIGRPEITYMTTIAREAALAEDPKTATTLVDAKLGKGDGKANLKAMRAVAGDLAAGLESALFGRMVTSDPEANTDAAIHVAHAITVHREETESDYFTVVDDLVRTEDGESGTAGIFDTELTSGLFYSYVVVDVEELVGNLGNDRDLAGRVVEHLMHLVATISPGAKKGSTAPYAYADFMMIEAGSAQPRSLAGAFRQAIPLDGDVLSASLSALTRQVSQFDAAYGWTGSRAALCAVPEGKMPQDVLTKPLDDLAKWASEAVGHTSAEV
jgi:CRISPR system Cascade subunit CasC